VTLSRTHTAVASLIATGALLGVPATGQAAGKGKQDRGAQGCTKVHYVPFSVRGILIGALPDDPTTAASEATAGMVVASANRYALMSGEFDTDSDGTKPGMQPGGFFSVATGDAFRLKLHGYQRSDTPSEGDKIRLRGRMKFTRRRCAPAGTSIAKRLGPVDVRKVVITDRDPDA